MLTTLGGTPALDDVAHIIQLALTPVFLLSGLATLLNVFSMRLGRVADRVDQASERLKEADEQQALILSAQLVFLTRRSWVLDGAVVLGAIGGASTCGTALALFVGTIRNDNLATALICLFAIALLCTIGALAAFLIEVLMASRGLRAMANRSDPDNGPQ
jgi:hypothetical protein